MATSTTRAQARSGNYLGTDVNGTAVFTGIRYATAERFRPPVPVSSRIGDAVDVEAVTYGAQCPQLLSPIEQMLGAGELPMSEDCHFLNVFTPSVGSGARPVMVWIHGGAFATGSGAMTWYHGSALAARGDVVVVTINYRLGALGFLDLGSISGDKYLDAGNLGLLDQVCALRWVQDNIEAFGGDPDNVTVFGESAGGASVVALLGSPSSGGLFHRTIAMSPSITQLRTADRAHEAAEEFLARCGVGVDGLLTLSVEQILQAQASILGNFQTGITAFCPTPTGSLFAGHPLDTAAANPLPLLIGTNRDEMLIYAQFDPETRNLDAAALTRRAAKTFGEAKAERATALYGELRDHDTPARLAAAIVTDETFRVPAWRLAQRRIDRGNPTWMYWFTWPTPALGGGLGACHALDLPFTFHNLDRQGVEMFTGDSPDRAVLADAVSDAVLAFATTGDPGWPEYLHPSRTTKRFDVPPSVLTDPEADLRELWASTTSA